MSRDVEVLRQYLDSEAADLRPSAFNVGPLGGGGPQVPDEIRQFLKADSSFESLGDAVVNPSSLTPENDGDGDLHQTWIKRSYRAVTLLCSDCKRAAEMRRRGAKAEDAFEAGALVMGVERAGLLAKRLFDAYSGGDNEGGAAAAHVPHVNHILGAMLEGYPNAVISAASAGGAASHLGHMLELPSSSSHSSAAASPLPVLNALVSTGCTGRPQPIGGTKPQSQQDPMAALGLGGQAPNHDIKPVVTKGHRKKFVRGLGEWGLIERMVVEMTSCSEADAGGGALVPTAASVPSLDSIRSDHAESLCDALLAVFDSAGYPPSPPPGVDPALFKSVNDADESIGEESLFSSILRPPSDEGHGNAVSMLANASAQGDPAAARALLGAFDLATGRSKLRSAPPSLDASDDGDVAAKSPDATGAGTKSPSKDDSSSSSEEDPLKNNKLRKMGVTSALHSSLVSSLDLVVRGIDLGGCLPRPYVTSEGSGEDETGAVRHPGRCIIERPFTTRRLNLITLLADVVSFEETGINSSTSSGGAGVTASSSSGGGGKKKKGGKGKGGSEGRKEPSSAATSTVDPKYVAASRAMDKLAELPLPPPPPPSHKPSAKSTSENTPNEASSDIVHNPWPQLVDLLFTYPENNLYQVQFYRLFVSPILANHEPTLKALVQKSKFVARSIAVCKKGHQGAASNRGVLVQCLNALRLRADTLGPKAWLRHYLDSHDTWKGFRDDLTCMTSEEQRPGGGIPPPPKTLPGGPAAVAGPPAMRMAALGQGAGDDTPDGEQPPLLEAEMKGEPPIDIGLGSPYAQDLGFNSSFQPYKPEDHTSVADSGTNAAEGDNPCTGGGGGGKKKKKKKKKKR